MEPLLDALSTDLVVRVLRLAAQRPPYPQSWRFNPRQVWFLAAVCHRLRALMAQIQPERLPLEVSASGMHVHRFAHNLTRTLPYFAVKKMDVHIRMLDALHEQYAFAVALGACTRLAELSLRTALTPGLMQALRRVGHVDRLTTLALWPRSMHAPEQMAGFVDLCAQLSSLTSLSIWDAAFTHGDVLGRALQQLPLRRFAFHDVHISATGLRNAVVDGLRFQSTLTELHLGLQFAVKVDQRPDQHGAASMTEEVFGTLVQLDTLRLLELHNLDTMGQTPALFDALPALTALRELNMRGCEVLDDALHHLAAALPRCTSLQRLDLSYNQIDLDGLNSLVQVLPQCTHLRRLDLSNNIFRAVPAEILEAIAAAATDVDYGYSATPEDSHPSTPEPE